MNVPLHRSPGRFHRGLLLVEVVGLAGALIAYRLFGHRIVEAAYDGRSIEVFNRALEGRSQAPVGLYLALADALAGNLVAVAVVLVLLQIGLCFAWRRTASGRGSSAAETRGVDGGASPERADSSPTSAVVPEAEPTTTGSAAGNERIGTPPLTRAKRIGFTLVVLLIPILFVTLPYAWRYTQYMSQLEVPPGLKEGTYIPPAMPELTPAQLLQVGGGHKEHAPPLQSYLNYTEAKPPGTIRVGIFGGSVSLGEEAALEHDLSTHLERRLSEAGIGDIEVINFGVSGFGVSQAALLWDFVGRKYDLDYTIMMPLYFHVRRDNSFLHTSYHYGPLHGVYVTEGDSVRYVPVIGKDRLDSCRRYFSPLQPAPYWRYDVRVPMAFRPLLPSPLDRRGNPFYYRKDERAVTVETYKHLFRKIAGEVDHLIVFTDRQLLPELRELQSDGIYVLASRLDEFRAKSSSLYRAPFDHPSGIGYEVYAEELAALLLGRERPVLRRLRVSGEMIGSGAGGTLSETEVPLEPDGPGGAGDLRGAEPSDRGENPAGPASLVRLSAMQDVKLSIGGFVVGEFRRRSAGEGRWGRLAERVDFGSEGIVGLAAYRNGGSHVFLPLPFELREGDEISVAWRSDGDAVNVPVGHVVAARGAIGQIDVDWSRLGGAARGTWSGRVDEGNEFGVVEIMSSERVDDVRLLVGGKVALVGETTERGRQFLPRSLRKMLLGRPWARSRSVLRPLASGFIYYRGCEGQYVDVANLETESGSVDLVFRDSRGEAQVVPFLPYEVVTVEEDRFDPPYWAPIGR